MKGKVKRSRSKTGTSQGETFQIPASIIYLLLGISVLVVFAIRISLAEFPLERDEGEYAYMATLFMDGHAPYTEAYNMKLPGTAFMYMVIMTITGTSVEGIRTGLAMMTCLSMVLVFLVGGYFMPRIYAVMASAGFGFMGFTPHVLGQAAHATHFVIFYALLGIWFCCRAYFSKEVKLFQWLLSGFFFALALLCKQSGLFFVLFGASALITGLVMTKDMKGFLYKTGAYTVGFIFPLALMIAYFYFIADFEKFRFWTVDYLRQYGSQLSLSVGLANFKHSFGSVTGNYSSGGYVLIWLSALIGLLMSFKKNVLKDHRILLVSLAIVSFLTIVPGYYFRSHYFVTLLPAAGILSGIFFHKAMQMAEKKFKINSPLIPFVTFVLIVVAGFSSNSTFLFDDPVKLSCKKLYGSNPFVEAYQAGRYIKAKTKAEDRIAILGSEPEICFYAERRSATGYIYTYNLMENHDYALTMQKEMIREIEDSRPEYLVYVDVGLSWLKRPESVMHITEWARSYVDSLYNIEALIEVHPMRYSNIVILERSPGYKPSSKEVMYLYRRKPDLS